MGKIILGYWNIRGLAEAARLMLEYGGLEYEDKRYQCDMDPPYDRSEWMNVKYTFGMAFPNLPYLIDGDTKISESWAIYRYIARKIGMKLESDKAQTEADMLEGVVNTLRRDFSGVCYNPGFADKRESMKASQLIKLKQFEDYLGDKKFLTGDEISHVDFAFYETLAHHQLLFPDIFAKFPKIQSYVTRFECLEKISAYLKSDRFKKFPINNPMAKWGGKYELD